MIRRESKAGSTPAGRSISKLYAVVRKDLAPGAKACQAAHALRAFAVCHEDEERAWWETSNTLVLLEAPLERLLALEREAEDKGLSCVRFVEPDWAPEGTLTALALGPGARRLVADLKLAYQR